MRADSIPWQAWAFLSAGFAASTAILGKVGVQGLNSDFATLIRTLVIVVVLALIVSLTGAAEPLSKVPPRSLLFLALSGLATGGSWICYYRALKLGPASGVAPIDKLSVVLVALFAAVFLREQLSPRAWAGVALIAGGAALVASGS